MSTLAGGDQGRPFKLQVISIVAVFAAVSAGLVLGSFAHNNQATAATQDEVAVLDRQNAALQAQVDQLNRDALTDLRFTEGLAPTILYGRLQGTKVLTLSTPSGAGSVEGVVRMLSSAGAVLTGSVQLTTRFTDPRYDDQLRDLAHAAPPSTVVGIPKNADGVAASAAVLSGVFMTRAPALSDADIRKVLDSYANAGFLRGTGPVSTPADVVVVVSGPPEANEDAVRRNAAAFAMVTQLARAGKVVVAANTYSGAGNLVAAVRADPALSLTVSTVDNSDAAIGRLLIAWAVGDQLAAHTNHYGTASGASLVPKIAL
jgi:hypothetical protein